MLRLDARLNLNLWLWLPLWIKYFIEVEDAFVELQIVGDRDWAVRREPNNFERADLLPLVLRNWVLEPVLPPKFIFDVLFLDLLVQIKKTFTPWPEFHFLVLALDCHYLRAVAGWKFFTLYFLHCEVRLVRHCEVENSAVLVGVEDVRFPHKNVLWVKAFVIHTYLLHLVLVEVNLNVFLRLENFIAHRAACTFNQPAIDAVLVENVEAAQYPAHRRVINRIHAYYALLHEVFTVLHPDQAGFYILVRLGRKAFLYSKPSAGDVWHECVLPLLDVPLAPSLSPRLRTPVLFDLIFVIVRPLRILLLLPFVVVSLLCEELLNKVNE